MILRLNARQSLLKPSNAPQRMSLYMRLAVSMMCLSLSMPAHGQLLRSYLNQNSSNLSEASPHADPHSSADRFAQAASSSTSSLDGAAFFSNAQTAFQDSSDAAIFDARGVLKAVQSAQISARIPATIAELPYKNGQYFDSGALLVSFNCARERAELEALQHAHAALSVKHQNTLELYNAGAAGQLDEAIAQAETARAAADIKVTQSRLTECEIYAPFAGYVQTRHVSPHDTPAAGTPLLSILRAGKPEITLIAPSAWMRWMKAGTSFEFTIDETANTHKAKITRLGAAVDPVSQTIEVTAHFTGSAKGALSGMSGIARFDPPQSVKDALAMRQN